MKQVKPYIVDISFLQSIIDGYKMGVFDNKGLPVRIMNALDSLSQYGQVQQYIETPNFPEPKSRKRYTKRSPYWNKSAQSTPTKNIQGGK